LAEVGEYVRVASLADVPPGTLLRAETGGRAICLANVDGEVYAFRDNCSHKDFPLSEGQLEGSRIECVWHGAHFDVTTGRALRLPAIKPIHTYEVKVEDGEIHVAIQE
jgi:nitrite reductase/ring-hydroxylating ferredoxin subunit